MFAAATASERTWAVTRRDIVAPVPSSDTLLAALDVVFAAATPFGDAELRHVFAEQQPNSVHAMPIVTPFHSSAVPRLTLAAYARHVANATGYGAEGLAVGLALMARYDRAAVARAAAAAAAASADNNTADVAIDATLVGVTALTMHRLFATCMQLGMKTASDHFVKNAYVARLVGMTLAELNALELELAVALDFRCQPTAGEMCELPSALADFAPVDGALDRHGTVRSILQRNSFDNDDDAGEPEQPEGKELPGFDDVLAGDVDEAGAGMAISSTSASYHQHPPAPSSVAYVAAASLTAMYHP